MEAEKKTNLHLIGAPRDASGHATKMSVARDMVEKGCGVKSIVKKTGINVEDARQMVRAHRESTVRRSNKELLEHMIADFRVMWTVARGEYKKKPDGKSAYQVQIMAQEQRALVEHMEKLDRPEAVALEIIQQTLQVAVKAILADAVGEGRRAMQKCMAVAENRDQQNEIEAAFQEFTTQLGTLAHGHYGMSATKVADIMKCKIEDIKKLAAAVDVKPGQGDINDTGAIPFVERR